ncbi:alpha/beta fold hydrolase [Sphaerimonospora cavernae]|uniref:Alpha/beta fold hydrolase n=1 Tax=Sphaerimonospora cavernae TaxID=1740611 RepID=A0ABV6U6Z2_9ACTN
MRRTLQVITAALSVSAATLLPHSPATAGTGAAGAGTTRSINWSPCEDDPTAECGTLPVPIDWARPGGPTIDLALARRKATDPAARIGSLVINPGGPGGSGVEAIIGEYQMTFSDEINRKFDIVGFDPRGIARSHPVVCSTDLLAQMPDPIMKSQADFTARLAYNRRLRDDCRARTGPLFDHVDTLSVARDLDAIRAALGERKLTYYGISYGTLIGQVYAETFPRNFRALALDSTMDHTLGTRAFLDTEAATVQDSFNEFVAWCERTSTCALHGKDIRAFWAGLLARAERGELHFPGYPDVPLNQSSLIALATSGFYGPFWAELADLLVAIDTGAEPSARAEQGQLMKLLAPRPMQEEVTGYSPPVFCEDYLLPIRDFREYATHLRRSARLAPDMRISPLAISFTAACLGRRAPIPNPQHRLHVRTNTPLLLGNALHDPATAYPWAVHTAMQLGRSGVLLTYEGWGHGIYGRGDCTTGAFDRYLVSLALPARGSRCPAVPPTEVTSLHRSPIHVPSGPIPGMPGIPGWTFGS